MDSRLELLFAIHHVREILGKRDPPLGFKRGQAVGPKDYAARLVILNAVRKDYKEGLLNHLMDIDPIETRRFFNEILDGRRTFDDTVVAESVRRVQASGHNPTVHERSQTAEQFEAAMKMHDLDFTPIVLRHDE